MKGLFCSASVQKVLVCLLVLGSAFYIRMGTASNVDDPALFSSTSLALAGEQPVSQEMQPIDINTATVDELVSLPGIGPKIAQEIVKYRETHGEFKNTDALLEVKGIGPKKLEKISPLLVIKPAGR